jgi:hypothetical protein
MYQRPFESFSYNRSVAPGLSGGKPWSSQPENSHCTLLMWSPELAGRDVTPSLLSTTLLHAGAPQAAAARAVAAIMSSTPMPDGS